MILELIVNDIAKNLVERVKALEDFSCEFEKNDWSYFCDDCIEKQATQAHEYKFSDFGKRD